MRPKLRFSYTWHHPEHTAFPNSLNINWGMVPCPINLYYRYVVNFKVKFFNRVYSVALIIEKAYRC